MNKKIGLVFIALLVSVFFFRTFNKQCFADDLNLDNDPFLKFQDTASSLFRPAPSYVLDKAGIINDSVQEHINNINNSTLNQVKGKPIIVVITSKDCDGESITEYSQKMFDKYHFGKSKLDNGVLIVINEGDCQVRVQTGYGMESILPDVYLNKAIVRAFTKHAKDSNMKKGSGQSGGGGAVATVNVVREELVHHKTYSQGTEELVNIISRRITDKLQIEQKDKIWKGSGSPTSDMSTYMADMIRTIAVPLTYVTFVFVIVTLLLRSIFYIRRGK
ncbi:TPM domain-containing protein [Lactobacillus johnsonii]|jgi:uncharacterized protein|uniref:TPM domain-containing protein n=1 Tax=Lactobacillus johnsonii TaxID=33959 RepID=A0A9X7XVP1_LACJH|nr:TPM domain-containing protein [Lactobacillus johnsonii]QIA88666.1 TPM domain-containing protein [Lactobacillus johnsonii]